MPIITPQELSNLQTNVRKAITTANPAEALALLGNALPASRAKHNQVILLKARQADIVQHTINNTLSEERLEVLRNNLTADILLFVDHLVLVDFQSKPGQRPGLKPGHLLYQVPTQMVLQSSYDCLVRVAEELNQVLEGLAGEEDLVIEDIGLTEVMEVEILDPGGTDHPVFDIMLLSDGEQVVDEYSYTEWVFNVRPLREGEHELILKISVLLTIKGKERTKNVILRRPISILAKTTEGLVQPELRRALPISHLEVFLETPAEQDTPARAEPPAPPSKSDSAGGSSKPLPSPTVPPRRPDFKRKSMPRSFLSLAATLLFLAFAGIWLAKSNGWGPIIPGEKQNTGDPGLETPVTLPDTVDSLQVPKRLLPDSLQID